MAIDEPTNPLATPNGKIFVHSSDTTGSTPSRDSSQHQGPAAVVRAGMQQKMEILGLTTTVFADQFLSPRSAYLPDPLDKACIDRIEAARIERDIYKPALEILNRISKRYGKSETLLCFVDNSDNTLCGLPHARLKPDLIVLEEQDVKRTPYYWSYLRSFIEVKRKKAHVPWQAASYACNVSEARPDAAGQLYMTMDSSGFYLFWQDASITIRSDCYKWSDPSSDVDALDILSRYVWTLYHPASERPLLDPAFTPVPDSDTQWGFTGLDFTTKWEKINSRPGPGRQTFVLRSIEPTYETAIIKSGWRDVDRRFKEEDLFEKLYQQGGFIPGLVHHVAAIPYPNPLKTKNSANKDHREKIVQHFDSRGLPLEECDSVLELLEAVYDGVQAHREIVERGVLHRDISQNNILIKPKHGSAKPVYDNGTSGLTGLPTPVKLIDQVLGPRPQTEPREGAGMLIDLDNGAETKAINAPATTERTGTLKFISISVGKSRYTGGRSKEPMPRLEGEALTYYVCAHGQRHYDQYSDAVKGGVFVDARAAGAVPSKFTHMPYHDIESFFWVLVWRLLLAWPEDADTDEGNNQDFISCHKIINTHELKFDARSELCGTGDQERWGAALHSGLASMGSFLAALDLYVGVNWVLWKDHGPPDHAHEAITRLLLQEIVRLRRDGPIPLRKRYRKPDLKTSADLTPKSTPFGSFV